MKNPAKLHYLEIVTPDVEKVCASYAQTMGAVFGGAIPELGGARTATLTGEVTLGIRAPMHDAEEPTSRPYYLVADIEQAVNEARNAGAEVAVPPMEIPGRGKCAILFHGPIQSGLWQV